METRSDANKRMSVSRYGRHFSLCCSGMRGVHGIRLVSRYDDLCEDTPPLSADFRAQRIHDGVVLKPLAHRTVNVGDGLMRTTRIDGANGATVETAVVRLRHPMRATCECSPGVATRFS